jgi:phage repressor protein C with HTH and peptisase S24 domain
LTTAAAARGLSLAQLSAAIRRNAAYLQQFVARGTPRRLAEEDRRVLAAMLGVSERALGGPDLPEPPFALPRLDVRASAGPGAFAERDDVVALEAVDPALARSLRLRPGRAGMVTVQGDSMEPQLNDGDQLIVDTGERSPGAVGRLYVIRVDGALMVKRVRLVDGRPVAVSDNPLAAPVPDSEVELVGRVVWRMGAPR